jgi:hypothetical protein
MMNIFEKLALRIAFKKFFEAPWDLLDLLF